MGTSGDSGGGLYNEAGELIGINAVRISQLNYFGSTGFYRTSLQNQWIDDTIASYIPEPSGLLLTILGAILVSGNCRRG